MTNLSKYPLEDNFKTSLTQSWDWSTGAVNVATVPTFTFPSWITTYIVVNPWKSNMQIATINAYDWTAKTLTVSDITLEKWASVNSTAQTHNVWSVVIISDNYQFWKDIFDAVNSKLDNDADWNWAVATDFAWIVSKSLTTAQRVALTWENWMIVYDTDFWVHYQYIGWAWSTFATWAVVNATETEAGKVELPTDAEVTAKTATWATWASLTPTNAQIGKSVALKAVDATLAETDHLVFDNAGTDNKMLVSVFRDQLAASTTAKGTVELATDAEALAWTDETRYINPKQLIANSTIVANVVVQNVTFDDVAISDIVIPHWLWKVPRSIIVRNPIVLNQPAYNAWIWTYDWTTITQKCYRIDSSPTIENQLITWADSNVNEYSQWAISAIDATNVTLTHSFLWVFATPAAQDFIIEFIW